MTTSRPAEQKTDPVPSVDKSKPGTTKPGTANKPAGQPALKGPLDKPRTA